MEAQYSQNDTQMPHLMTVADVAIVLDQLASSATDPWDLLLKLNEYLRVAEQEKVDKRPNVVPFIERALAYAFRDDSRHEGAVIMGVRWSSKDGRWPPGFDDTSEEEKRTWLDVAESCDHSLPRAHLLDVAFSAGMNRGRESAEEIASLYLDVASQGDCDAYYRASCLRRAWSLGRSYAIDGVEQRSRQCAFDVVTSQFESSSVVVNVLLQLFEFLTVMPRTDFDVAPTRVDVQNALRALRSQLVGSEKAAEVIADLLVRVACSEADRDEARRALVKDHIAFANAESGMRASLWYEQAADEARRYHFPDLRSEAVRGLQAHPLGEDDMHVFSFESLIPRYVLDWRLGLYRQSNDFCGALDIWLATPSPTGSYDKNLADAKTTTRGRLFARVASTMFDGAGMPVRTTQGQEAAEYEQLERIEQMSAGVHGSLLANELSSILDEYRMPPTQVIVRHLLTAYRCDVKLAELLVDALQAFWSDRYFDACLRAYPLVEAGIRGLLLLLDAPLYRTQTGENGGRFPSLETYIGELEKRDFDRDWIRCLRNPIAVWRNALAHGHKHDVRAEEAAVLLRVAALFVVLASQDATEQSEVVVEERLRDPVSWVAKRANMTGHWEKGWVLSWRPDVT